jgi:hypothetical protein
MVKYKGAHLVAKRASKLTWHLMWQQVLKINVMKNGKL